MKHTGCFVFPKKIQRTRLSTHFMSKAQTLHTFDQRSVFVNGIPKNKKKGFRRSRSHCIYLCSSYNSRPRKKLNKGPTIENATFWITSLKLTKINWK